MTKIYETNNFTPETKITNQVQLVRHYELGEESMIWDVVFTSTHKTIAKDYHSDLIERWAPRNYNMMEWTKRLVKTNPFVCLIDQKIVGMAEIEKNGFIHYFYTHPDFQGKGVGKSLLAAIELQASRSGLKIIFADVSLTAKGFFHSQGFIVKESKSNIILGHSAPNFRMEKKLNNQDE